MGKGKGGAMRYPKLIKNYLKIKEDK